MKTQLEGGKVQIQQFRFMAVWSNEDFYPVW